MEALSHVYRDQHLGRNVLGVSTAEHVDFVRAALRDELGRAGVDMDDATLTRLAEVARKATLTWMIGAAKNGTIETHVCDEMCDHE